ncbi:CHAP domain-containing protein [Candidatus Dojkabacteria bacterium]|jgi:hypothetical protein|nr:CHAP domain-containing protein [Candidatus Dojkabacteria bacterium]
MTFDEFKVKYTGKGIDFDGYYGFQCMDLAHQYAVEVVGKDFAPAPAAKDVWNQTIDGYDKIPNTPTGVPTKGDIIIWGTGIGAYGHIAVFDNGDANSFTSFDQNWPLNSLCHLQQHNYTGVLGWFHPQKDVNANYQDLYNACRIDRDNHWNDLQAEKTKTTQLTIDLQNSTNQLNNANTTIVTLNERIKVLEASMPPQTDCSLFINKLKQIYSIASGSWLTWLRGRNTIKELSK